MTKLFCALLMCLALPVKAAPTDELMQQINTHVVRIQVALANGQFGVGSGVTVAENEIVTNCHVIANAHQVNVVVQGENYPVSAIKADWQHDVCIVKVSGLKITPVKMVASKNLKYEQAVVAVGYPDFCPFPSASQGFVKGVFAMDDGVVIRSTSVFRQGASGGGLFDDEGNLVGIIALKSPGRHAYYYELAVEWVQALLTQPEQAVVSKSELPFWAEVPEKWPFFMRVVQPYLTEDWPALLKIAADWTQAEPTSTEAWFYRAAAEFETKDMQNAEVHLRRVIALNDQHSQAIYYLGLIAEANGDHNQAMHSVALLNTFDADTANQLKLAMGMRAENQ